MELIFYIHIFIATFFVIAINRGKYHAKQFSRSAIPTANLFGREVPLRGVAAFNDNNNDDGLFHSLY